MTSTTSATSGSHPDHEGAGTTLAPTPPHGSGPHSPHGSGPHGSGPHGGGPHGSGPHSSGPDSWFVPAARDHGARAPEGPPTSALPAVRTPAPGGPPAPRVTQCPPGATDLPAAAFSWVAVPGLVYESRLDDGPWQVGHGGWFTLFIDLPAGPHRFYLRAVDAGGARSQVSRYDWVVAPR